MTDKPDDDSTLLATELTIAWLANPNTRVNPDDVPGVLASMYEAVRNLGKSAAPEEAEVPEAPEHKPAVSIRKSLADPDFIVSLIDGKKYRSLRRHLNAHGLTPEDYRQRYGLKPDYPMVAPGYSAARRAVAKKLGLGRKPGTKITKSPDQQGAARRARKSKNGDAVTEE
ncbi:MULTISPECIES: MucR family transcriptional regulator [unclassified Sphingomonas]|uniref:MucR family transcriptional regulator n=1 Tax=unclassified Sphingomonas TaxID=196159 RepID=UPI001D0F857D|nr:MULTISPECIES: MucR family transcriptional regulator [unclassified Sphingomonas]MCC2979494.1 MucR family transcriptional regulator [Sphingomonas sp. IC4-52]MCD2315277.1 MucR family transcriptional regulator [Sphingomonas sp. IC-11]